tara:strand:+ start:677 stop:856 length:180 start_codon:yes stop_codon:yes gene_type:complete
MKVNKIFISYLDDDDKTISGFVDLIEKTETMITFETQKNKITIPMARVLKIKEQRGKDD